MLNRPIAVLGGGNAGYAIAADLALGGYEVNFYEHPQFKSHFEAVLESKSIEAIDDIRDRCGLAKLHKVTTDMKVAIGDAKLILMAIPSFGQELFFDAMIPHLKDGQVVVLMTGNFGSLRLWRVLKEKGIGHKITMYETNTMPYGTRLGGPTTVHIHRGFGPWLGTQSLGEGLHFHGLICALPAKDTGVALEGFQELYPLFYPTENVLTVALNNGNFVMHPVTSLLNAGRIEYSKGDFRLHREGHTPSVLRAEMGVRNEMAVLTKALGGKDIIPETKMEALFNFNQKIPIEQVSIGPRTLKDRYITEDIPYGLVPMSQLGRKLGIATPLINAFIEIASVMNEEDYRKTGRTLEAIGLGKLNKEQIIQFVQEGVIDQ